jgi:hypothetical protein
MFSGDFVGGLARCSLHASWPLHLRVGRGRTIRHPHGSARWSNQDLYLHGFGILFRSRWRCLHVLHAVWRPRLVRGPELDAIAAVVIGGTLLSGGVGFVTGTAMGVPILGLIQTLITFQGNLNTWWTRIVVGILVLVFILLQNVITSASRKLGETQQR